jgi:putative ABC transport system substrate-binding protein
MRHFVAVLVLWACLAASAIAQDRRSMPAVGVLMVNTPANAEPIASLFRNALAALGYADGRSLRLDFRFAEGQVERFPALAEALVVERLTSSSRSAMPRRAPLSRRRARSRSSRSLTISSPRG